MYVPKMRPFPYISGPGTTHTSVFCIIFSYLWIIPTYSQSCYCYSTNHYHPHHFPWPCISVQLSPISLLPFRKNHLQRDPYTVVLQFLPSCSPLNPLHGVFHPWKYNIYGHPLMISSCLLTFPAIYMLMTLTSKSLGRPLRPAYLNIPVRIPNRQLRLNALKNPLFLGEKGGGNICNTFNKIFLKNNLGPAQSGDLEHSCVQHSSFC